MPHWMPPAGIAMRLEAHFADRMVHCFADRIHDIYDLLSNAAQTRPQGEAVILGGIRLTYAALLAQVEQVAAGLAMRGIRQGDRVALLMGNHLEFVITCLAAFRLGAIAVPIGHRLQAPEVAYILEHCGAALVVFEAGLADRIPPADTGPRLRVCLSSADIVPEGSETFTDLRTVTAPLPERPVVAEEDTAVILYTSGTTGRPKGAMLTHFNLSHSLLHFQYGMDLGPEDRLLLAVPASHVTGLVAVILLSLQVKATLIMMPEFTARAFLRLAAAERMTHSILVPAMYNLCLMDPEFTAHDLSRWRIGGYGGAPMPEATIAGLARALPRLSLMNAYGATETTSPATMLPSTFAAVRGDSVGMPLHCAEIRIMSPEGHELPPGEAGEIWIGGPMVVPGYWNNPEATRDNFTAGYWHSGDIGTKDADNFVCVFDRLKDMINRGGYKIFSVEVENVLAGYPGVVESAVVGRACPVLGERVHAFVVGRIPDIDPADLKAYCATRLADYKVPESITLLTQPLPRNANGKLLKRTLRQLLPA